MAHIDKKDDKLKLYCIDVFSAIFAAMTSSPFIKIIDQTVTQKSAFKRVNIFKTAKNNFVDMVKSPIVFLKGPAFLAVFGVYAGTYIASNCLSTYFDDVDNKMHPVYALTGTTLINMYLGMHLYTCFQYYHCSMIYVCIVCRYS